MRTIRIWLRSRTYQDLVNDLVARVTFNCPLQGEHLVQYDTETKVVCAVA